MASVTWQGLSGFVQTQIAALQSAAKAVIDATVGSVSLAWAQAVSGAALFLQALIVNVLALTRFATSFGADADSWGAQWGFPRLAATSAKSTETFSRFTPTQQAMIAGGTVVNGVPTGGALISTGPGGVQFMVMADTTNAAWNPTIGAFVLAVNTASITLPIMCVTPGSIGNVLENTIQSFVSPIPGVDTCTNPSDIGNGIDPELDPAYKARFPDFLASLQSANNAAINYAVESVQQGLDFEIIENMDYPGLGTDNGSFFVIVDDGSGNPPATLLTAISNSVMAAKADGVRTQGAFGPSLVSPPIVANYRLVPTGFSQGVVDENVITAIIAAVNATQLNAGTLYISDIETAMMAVPGVLAVQPGATKINGVAADFVLTTLQRPRISGTNITLGHY